MVFRRGLKQKWCIHKRLGTEGIHTHTHTQRERKERTMHNNGSKQSHGGLQREGPTHNWVLNKKNAPNIRNLYKNGSRMLLFISQSFLHIETWMCKKPREIRKHYKTLKNPNTTKIRKHLRPRAWPELGRICCLICCGCVGFPKVCYFGGFWIFWIS